MRAAWRLWLLFFRQNTIFGSSRLIFFLWQFFFSSRLQTPMSEKRMLRGREDRGSMAVVVAVSMLVG